MKSSQKVDLRDVLPAPTPCARPCTCTFGARSAGSAMFVSAEARSLACVHICHVRHAVLTRCAALAGDHEEVRGDHWRQGRGYPSEAEPQKGADPRLGRALDRAGRRVRLLGLAGGESAQGGGHPDRAHQPQCRHRPDRQGPGLSPAARLVCCARLCVRGWVCGMCVVVLGTCRGARDA
eukprot:2747353-Rhodomonas_salina.1